MKEPKVNVGMGLAAMTLLAGCAGLTLSGCSRNQPQPAASSVQTSWIDESKLVDLTHPFDTSTIYWPTNQPFRLTRAAWGMTPGGWWYASNDYSASEHGGTHTDAPIHFHEGGASVDQIPLNRLIGPAAVMDVRASCKDNPDYMATEDDLRDWERENGELSPGSIMILQTGWGERWPDRLLYLGSDKVGDATGLHFPGLSESLARVLAQKKVAGVGLDTASLDPGISKDFKAHQILSGADIYGLENLMNLDKLPAKGATLVALPMKIGGGSGGPTRVIAILP